MGWPTDGAPPASRRRSTPGSAELVPDADRPRSWTLLVNGTPQSHVDLDDPALPGLRVRPAARPPRRPGRPARRAAAGRCTSAAAG